MLFTCRILGLTSVKRDVAALVMGQVMGLLTETAKGSDASTVLLRQRPLRSHERAPGLESADGMGLTSQQYNVCCKFFP